MADKFSKLALIAAILVGLILLAVTSFHSPGIAEEKAKSSMEEIGLDTSLMPAVQNFWGHAVYKDVSLDKDSISTLKLLDFKYNPFSILFSGKADSVLFDELNITGAWDPAKTPVFDFSGWKIPQSIAALMKIPTRHMQFHKTKFSFLTPDLGGISIAVDMNGAHDGDKFKFQSHIESGQQNISFSAGADGVIAKDFYDIDIDVDEAKFDVPQASMRATRINGTMSFSKDVDTNPSVTADLQAGGLTVLGTLWKEASLNFENRDGVSKILCEAKSVGVEDIELSLNIQKKGIDPVLVFGTVHADDGKALATYLQQQTTFQVADADLKAMKTMTDVKLDFLYEQLATGEKKIKYHLGDLGALHEIIVK